MSVLPGNSWKVARRGAVAFAAALLIAAVGRAPGAASVAEAQIGGLQVSAGGPYSAQAGQPVTFYAQATGGFIVNTQALQFQWSFGDGTSAFGQFVTHTYQAPGTYNVTVSASNGAGLYGTAATFAQIGGSSVSGQVSAGGPYSGQTGVPITFTAGASSPFAQSGQALQFQWSFGDGGSAFGQTTSHTYSASGTYTVTVTVSSNFGQFGSATTTAQVGASNQTGQVSAGGPYSGQIGLPITFSAQMNLGLAQSGLATQFQWSFGDGGTAFGQTTTHTYAAAGTYTVTVTATSASGAIGSATTTAQVGSTAQTGQVNPGGPYSGQSGLPITFTATVNPGYPPFDATAQFQWSFGDGTTGAGQTTSHSYASPGTYTVTVTISSTTGQYGSATTTATVNGAASAVSALEQVPLQVNCNNVALTWPNGTALSVVQAAISPAGSLIAIWRFDNLAQRYSGYSPLPGAPNDLLTVNRGDPVFICMSSGGTLSRPQI